MNETMDSSTAIDDQRAIVEKYIDKIPNLMTVCGATDRNMFVTVMLGAFLEGRDYQIERHMNQMRQRD